MSDVKTRPRPAPTYEGDFYAWTQDQAAQLRELRPNSLDWENIAEEIESLGKSDKRALGSDLRVVVEHLLKWRFQPERRSDSWRDSINEHRDRIERIIDDSPSLRSTPAVDLAKEYVRARRNALSESGLASDAIPTACPVTMDEILDPDFYPDAPAA